jgi:hypothetical protein
LPAKSRIGSEFLMFFSSTPEGMERIDEVTLGNGRWTIIDRASGQSLVLAASRGL